MKVSQITQNLCFSFPLYTPIMSQQASNLLVKRFIICCNALEDSLSLVQSAFKAFVLSSSFFLDNFIYFSSLLICVCRLVLCSLSCLSAKSSFRKLTNLLDSFNINHGCTLVYRRRSPSCCENALRVASMVVSFNFVLLLLVLLLENDRFSCGRRLFREAFIENPPVDASRLFFLYDDDKSWKDAGS